MFNAYSYLDDVSPLFEDESFYTNDFLLNKILDIYNVCVKLIEDNNPNSILPGKLVYYFLNGFKITLEFDYEHNFSIMPNMTSLAIGLTGYVYWEMPDYEDVLYDIALSVWKFSSAKWLDYCTVSVFLYMVEYVRREYGLEWDISLMDEFTEYWKMIEHFVNVPSPSRHADYLIDLAGMVLKLKDFTKASIQPILDYFSVDLSYEPPFRDAVTADSLSYLYCELIGIIFLGYREKKLQWVEYSKTKIKTGYMVIEIARDPLYPDWFLQRQVDYVVLNPFPEEHYTLNPATNIYERNYCFLAEFMLIF